MTTSSDKKPRDPKPFSQNLKFMMKALNLIQADIVAATNASSGNVSGWVNEGRTAAPKNRATLAKFFGVTPQWLITKHEPLEDLFPIRLTFKIAQSKLSRQEIYTLLNVSYYILNSWMTGKKAPNEEQLNDLAAVLDTTPSWLLHGDSEAVTDNQGMSDDATTAETNPKSESDTHKDAPEPEPAPAVEPVAESDPESADDYDDDYDYDYDDDDDTLTDIVPNEQQPTDSESKDAAHDGESTTDTTGNVEDSQDQAQAQAQETKAKKSKKRKDKKAKAAKKQQIISDAVIAKINDINHATGLVQALALTPTALDLIDIEVYAPFKKTVIDDKTKQPTTKGKEKLKRMDAEKFTVSRDVFEKSGASAENTIGFYNTNTSMSPTIMKGAKCLADKSKTQIINGEIYLFRYQKALGIAHLHHLPDGGLVLRCANRNKAEEFLSAEEAKGVKIIGWVFSVTNTATWQGN